MSTKRKWFQSFRLLGTGRKDEVCTSNVSIFFIDIFGLDVVDGPQNQVSVGMYVVAVGIEKISSAAAAAR